MTDRPHKTAPNWFTGIKHQRYRLMARKDVRRHPLITRPHLLVDRFPLVVEAGLAVSVLPCRRRN